MEQRAAFREEVLEITIPNEGNHEEEESDGDEEQAGEGIGGLDEKLVVRSGAEKLGRRLNAVAESVNLLHVEHHEASTGYRDERVENADHEKRRR